jgi:hypothetical protein
MVESDLMFMVTEKESTCSTPSGTMFSAFTGEIKKAKNKNRLVEKIIILFIAYLYYTIENYPATKKSSSLA